MTVEFFEVIVNVDERVVTETQVIVDRSGSITAIVIVVGVCTISVVVNTLSLIVVEFVLSVSHVVIVKVL